jgi:hypothetical protein
MNERPILMSAPMVRATLDERSPKTHTRRVMMPQPDASLTRGGTVTHFKPIGVSVKSQRAGYEAHDASGPLNAFRDGRDGVKADIDCPYGAVGGRLWVRETFALTRRRPDFCDSLIRGGVKGIVGQRDSGRVIEYAANERVIPKPHWLPSIHMPRWASRISLEITGIRVEQLHAVTDESAIAEGIDEFGTTHRRGPFGITALGALAGIMASDKKLSRRGFLASTIAAGLVTLGADGKAERASARGAFAHLWESINGPRGFGWDENPWVWVIEFKRVTP